MKRIGTPIFIFLLLLITSIAGQAQEYGQRKGQRPGSNAPKRTIKGQIVDSDSQQALEYATITLFSQRDSSMVTGGITDQSGAFLIETRPGRFFAMIEFLGYENLRVPKIDLSKGKFLADLGILSLKPNAEVLAEVEVRAEKSEMQFLLDKKVFNVGKDLSNTSSSAAELLDNVPSVAVDIDGGVTLRGSGNVRILIDGKPSGMIGVGDTDGLRSIPANLIEKVEVITNPSARYEAAGTTGIINIVLRKERKKGLNGSFDFSVGAPKQMGTAINLNYRREKINLFVNYGLRWRNNPGGGFTNQEFYTADTTFISQQKRNIDRSGLSNSFRFGADYFLGKKSTLTTAFTYRINDEDNFSELEYLDYINSTDNLVLRTDRSDQEREDETDALFSLNYKKTFDREGQEFTTDFQFQSSAEVETSQLTEQYFNPDNSSTGGLDLQQRSEIDESNTEWLLKMDYVHPFGEHGKWESGYRGSLRQIRNDYIVEQFDDVEWLTLPGFSNNFIYDENIHGLYTMFGNKQNKFSYQLGLRFEYTDVRTELLQTQETNPRDYFNFFPTASLTYDLPNKNALQLSYSRRITRPRFWYLNPFLTFSDARNIYTGNPDLDPELTHSVEFAHIKYFEKGSLSSGIYFRHTDDKIERIREVVDNANAYIIPRNLSTENAFGLEFTYSYTIAKWWRANGDFNFFRSIIDGKNLGSSFTRDDYSWSTRFASKVTFWKKLDTQVSLRYRGPIETTQGFTKAIYAIDLGMSMDILKGKGTLTLSARDLLNTRKRRSISEGENFYSEGEFQWRSRQLSLNLNYRLNQKKKRGGARQGYGGGEDGF